MATDKTGRKLKIGQIVDVVMLGTFSGKVVSIKDKAIVLSASQQLPAHIVIQMPVTPYIQPDGMVTDVYITAEPDPKDPIVIAAEKSAGPKLVV